MTNRSFAARRTLAISICLLLAPVLAGCATEDDGGGTTTTTTPAAGTTTTHAATTPAATTPAGTTPPVTTTPATDGGPSVAFVDAPPASAAPFASVDLVWRIDSATAGTTPHTALHADAESHPDAATLSPAAYPLSYYPGEGPYAFPGEFRVTLSMPADGALYVRPHAIIAGQHVWGDEAAIMVEGASATGVALVSYPPSARAGVPFDVSWRVDAPEATTTPHSAVHYGPSAVDKPMADLRPADYPHATAFQSGDVPNEFTATVTPREPGFLHFRGHTIIGGVHYWTEEVVIAVAAPESPNVLVVDAPSRVAPGADFTVSWRVNAPTTATTPHSAVHYGPESKADVPDAELTPAAYPSATEFHSGEVPAAFEDTLTAPADAQEMFLRAHVILDGVHYWSEEMRITIAEA